jgi:pilus assembly protein Flp/PilA
MWLIANQTAGHSAGINLEGIDMTKLINKLRTNTSGASAAEYALIISLVAVAIIVGATALGSQINTRLSGVASTIAAP